MRPRFRADADFNEDILEGLRRREPAIDILPVAKTGVVRPDRAVLEIGHDLGRVVVSHDCNTMTAAFYEFIEQHESPGLVIVPQRLAVGRAIEQFLVMWLENESEDFRNQIRYLQRRLGSDSL